MKKKSTSESIFAIFLGIGALLGAVALLKNTKKYKSSLVLEQDGFVKDRENLAQNYLNICGDMNKADKKIRNASR